MCVFTSVLALEVYLTGKCYFGWVLASVNVSFVPFWLFSNISLRDNFSIGGFQDTYLGRHVSLKESRDGVSWGSGEALRAPLVGSGGAPAEIEFGAFLALKSDIG